MSQFIQLHLLTSYPPANLNRDDTGRPKTARMGGFDRLRISSQSLKRHWRVSDLFQSALAGHLGFRTKRFGLEIYQQLIEADVKEKQATECASAIAGVFGKNKKDTPLEIEQLAHISPTEKAAVKISPSGKQNSFGSRAYASYVLAEKGEYQPRSLSGAFLKPINDEDQAASAIRALEEQVENFDKVYGDCADARHSINTLTGEGSFAELIKFVTN